MPAIYHEGSWLGNATDPEVLVKDTVGWTGKNLLKNTATTQTINGVTFTVNADGSVTVNGTATANTVFPLNLAIKSKLEENGKYILSGCPSGGATNKYRLDFRTVTASSSTDAIYNDIGEGVTFTLTNAQYSSYELGVTIRIENGATVDNLTFYPMLRKADITDPTYEPYHESVEVMYEEEIHGVNLLDVTATIQTINGVTFTVNADGSVTANGTATSNGAELKLHTFGINDTVVGKKLILSGCPTGGGATTYRLMGFRVADASGVSGTIFETGEEETFDYLNNVGTGYISLQIRPNYTANNLVFKPMLRKADIEDSTYRPYNEQAIQNQLNAQGVLGAKNLLPYPFYQTTRTTNGITFTDNGDGTITANGTATADAIFHCLTHITGTTFYQSLAGKAVILSGCPAGGANNKYYFGIYDTSAHNDVGEGLTYQVLDTPPSSFYIQIVIRSGITVNNLKFYPMIRLASDPDDTYQPYAMTNRELTEKKINIADLKTVVSASSDFADFKTRIASL